MRSFEFDIEMNAPAERVLDAFWRLENWPEIAEHVTGIEIAYEDPVVQVLDMVVRTRGKTDRFQTVRILKGDTIHYLQPSPPPLLRHHHGKWIVSDLAGGSRVTSVHTIEVDNSNARAFLGLAAATDEDVCEAAVADIIRNNSLQTMRALKLRLESEAGSGEVRVA